MPREEARGFHDSPRQILIPFVHRMIAIACLAMTIFHPALFCKPGFFNDKRDNDKASSSKSEEDRPASDDGVLGGESQVVEK